MIESLYHHIRCYCVNHLQGMEEKHPLSQHFLYFGIQSALKLHQGIYWRGRLCSLSVWNLKSSIYERRISFASFLNSRFLIRITWGWSILTSLAMNDYSFSICLSTLGSMGFKVAVKILIILWRITVLAPNQARSPVFRSSSWLLWLHQGHR